MTGSTPAHPEAEQALAALLAAKAGVDPDGEAVPRVRKALQARVRSLEAAATDVHMRQQLLAAAERRARPWAEALAAVREIRAACTDERVAGLIDGTVSTDELVAGGFAAMVARMAGGRVSAEHAFPLPVLERECAAREAETFAAAEALRAAVEHARSLL